MVVLFVVLSILLMVSIDYFIQRKKKLNLAETAESLVSPLTNFFNILPRGLFIQNQFTWTKILDSGNILLGIHPVLLGLVGNIDEIELLHKDESVNKGDSFLKIKSGKKQITLKSPVKGKITAINDAVLAESSWQEIGQSWLYSIEPQNVTAEIPSWYISENAENWIKQKYGQIKSFLMNSVPQGKMGVTLADGGDLPVGILSQFENDVWNKFEVNILSEKKKISQKEQFRLNEDSSLFLLD